MGVYPNLLMEKDCNRGLIHYGHRAVRLSRVSSDSIMVHVITHLQASDPIERYRISQYCMITEYEYDQPRSFFVMLIFSIFRISKIKLMWLSMNGLTK